MARFDEWGLLPKDHEGPHDNPLLVTTTHGGPEVRGRELVMGERAPLVVGVKTGGSRVGGPELCV